MQGELSIGGIERRATARAWLARRGVRRAAGRRAGSASSRATSGSTLLGRARRVRQRRPLRGPRARAAGGAVGGRDARHDALARPVSRAGDGRARSRRTWCSADRSPAALAAALRAGLALSDDARARYAEAADALLAPHRPEAIQAHGGRARCCRRSAADLGVDLVPGRADRLEPQRSRARAASASRSNASRRPATSAIARGQRGRVVAARRARRRRRRRSPARRRPRWRRRADRSRQRLQQHDRQVLEAAREHEQVGRAHQLGDLRRRSRAEERHAADPAGARRELRASSPSPTMSSARRRRAAPRPRRAGPTWRFFSASVGHVEQPQLAAARARRPGGRAPCRRGSPPRGSAPRGSTRASWRAQVLADRADEVGVRGTRSARAAGRSPVTSPRWKAVKCSLTTTGTPSRRPSSTAGKPASNTWAWITSGRQSRAAQDRGHAEQLRRHRRRAQQRAPVDEPLGGTGSSGSLQCRYTAAHRLRPERQHAHVVAQRRRAGLLAAEQTEHRPVRPRVPLGQHEHPGHRQHPHQGGTPGMRRVVAQALRVGGTTPCGSTRKRGGVPHRPAASRSGSSARIES